MAAESPIVEAIMGGADPRHYLSAGMAALASDSNGVPFNGSWVVGSGNLAADMYANVMAESTGRVLATRLWNITEDKGMKDMLAFLIARDTMHQNQWLAVLEEIGGLEGNHPIPNSFPQSEENSKFSYAFLSTNVETAVDEDTAAGRWASGKSIDGKGEFTFEKAMPFGEKPNLSPPHPDGFAQTQQMIDKDDNFIKSVFKNL
jgi:Mn-containing catalase